MRFDEPELSNAAATAARMAMMVMTTSNSIRVKALFRRGTLTVRIVFIKCRGLML
jgi:hypothetical protein